MSELIIRRGLSEPETDASFVPHKPSRPEKAEGGKAFKLVSDYTPAGDQPAAIAELVAGVNGGDRDQVLLASQKSWVRTYRIRFQRGKLNRGR